MITTTRGMWGQMVPSVSSTTMSAIPTEQASPGTYYYSDYAYLVYPSGGVTSGSNYDTVSDSYGI